MVKHRYADGFTMIEMLLVLGILSTFVLLMPIAKEPISLHIHMQRMKEQLLSLQTHAILNKKTMNAQINTTQMICGNETFTYAKGIVCDPSQVSFNALGNVNQARTIHCFANRRKMKLVIQLGSGRMRIE